MSYDDGFVRKAEAVTGMSWAEIQFWGEREEFEEQQYAKDRGHCCWAGAVAHPDVCPWHSRFAVDDIGRSAGGT